MQGTYLIHNMADDWDEEEEQPTIRHRSACTQVAMSDADDAANLKTASLGERLLPQNHRQLQPNTVVSNMMSLGSPQMSAGGFIGGMTRLWARISGHWSLTLQVEPHLNARDLSPPTRMLASSQSENPGCRQSRYLDIAESPRRLEAPPPSPASSTRSVETSSRRSQYLATRRRNTYGVVVIVPTFVPMMFVTKVPECETQARAKTRRAAIITEVVLVRPRTQS
ncbi:hypothetical protein NM208_g6841 [Fusarium decemcellulare]|uniref:Uncharacterized protein n=1 Tax=Fusarium decemcellulare TaxID=57161 RepID=A0ACC1SBD0_9HYPO|nr:hypothetical protein NM208_g6841 [Fusarium decemcellulare]